MRHRFRTADLSLLIMLIAAAWFPGVPKATAQEASAQEAPAQEASGWYAGATEDKAAFTILSVNDGLGNASISGIIQDSSGFIWFATQGGLYRYDGLEFTAYENEPFNTNSLSGDLIQTTFQEKNGIFWLGSYNGLNRFNPATGEFIRYRFDVDRADSLSNDLVIAIARDARGELWVGSGPDLLEAG